MDWNTRFSASEDYVFGTDPARFLPAHAARFRKGDSALLVADGEGRNSVWLAEQGLRVTAFDGAPAALAKARALAATRGVEVEFLQADAATFDWGARQHDLTLGIFIQFAEPPLRDAIFAGMLRATRPGGLLLLHGYTPRQLVYGTGGPPREELLYTPGLLRGAFAAHEILELHAYERELDEGHGHVGRSALIDLIVRKREGAAPD